ncbi:hypothetical protein B0H66DRAFT_479704 [Apodospora peruviana]|uniref:DUF1996 domain-containing protein n=1 Tax=Apodospora peruviana TaxID=516989 RepID=A0AAE0HZX5_9PEZI|nr:hypothetical protein B0H66DRAFT_479704 [Apodospora peruviana]
MAPQWKPLILTALLGLVVGQDPGPFDPATANIPPMLRFQCNQLVIDRLDPLVNPGVVPSPHIHQIVGGNSFNASMDPKTHDLVKQSGCTSCSFSEDFSNYWTAVLYFRARNGTYRRVPQKPSEGFTGVGGITVYYIPPLGKANTTAFRPGFRMLVGEATLRSMPQKYDPKVCHRCMPKTGDNNNLNCAPPDGVTLPHKFCEGGIRSVITFPTCWDGVNLDSADHKSHVAYPLDGSITDRFDYDGGVCPNTHPVKIPQVMYEVVWDTTMFNDKDLWPEDGSQPFVWSTGDENGYSQHGDYVFGWKGDALQRAMDAKCTGDVCSVLESQPADKAVDCTIDRVVQEDDINGWVPELPGSVMKR